MTRKRKALCLYGKIGSASGKIDHQGSVDLAPLLCGHRCLSTCFKAFDEFDIFIHCWDAEHQDTVTSLYKPKAFIFEEQRQFSLPIERETNDKNPFLRGDYLQKFIADGIAINKA